MNTTVENPAFFKSNVESIRSLQARIQRNPNKSQLTEEFLTNLNFMLSWMVEYWSSFDKNCAVNIASVGAQFELLLRDLNERDSKHEISEMYFTFFTLCYRFVSEFSFNESGDRLVGFSQVEKYVRDNLDLFPPADKKQLVYANYLMPARMMKAYLDGFKKLEQSDTLRRAQKWDEVLADWKKNLVDWKKSLDEREDRVNALKLNLDKQKSQYNFIGLVDGFTTLKEKKSTEQAQAFKLLLVFGGAMLAIPLLQVFGVIPKWDHNLITQGDLGLVLPVLVCELILFYFFRIVLRQYNSVKAQLLQLDLRISLCQFIESYTEHMMKVKEKDPGVLQKFESLIFSGLMTDGEKIPSVLDGTEQLANLIRSVKQSSS